MRPARTPADTPAGAGEGSLALWYELGRLYSGAGGAGGRALRLGFTVALVAGALVLLSVPLFGTTWAGPFAPAIPVALGLLAGGGKFALGRARLENSRRALGRALSGEGLDPARPAKEGLHAYYDAQLILLRSEYEFLRSRGSRNAVRIFEESFGFTPEDPFETGPLNVAPDTEAVRLLRERWERRLATRRELGVIPPALGLRENLAHRVFPREMTVPVELATRGAYLSISREVLKSRYGRDPRRKANLMPEGVRRRMERDLREYAALTERSDRRPRPGGI